MMIHRDLCKTAQHYFAQCAMAFCLAAFNTSLPQPLAYLQLRLFTGWPHFEKAHFGGKYFVHFVQILEEFC